MILSNDVILARFFFHAWVPPPEARPRTVYRVEIRPARIQNEEPATLTIENALRTTCGSHFETSKTICAE